MSNVSSSAEPLNFSSSNFDQHPQISIKAISIKATLKSLSDSLSKVIKDTPSCPKKAFKATAILLGSIFMLSAALTFFALSIIFHLLAYPFTLKAWNKTAMIEQFTASIKESIALALAVLSFPINGTSFDPPPEAAKDKTPILLVHGYLHNSSGWHFMRHQLEQQGLGPIYTINLGGPFDSIEDYAQRVKAKVESIGCKDLILIGHSMGGLVSSEYATTHAKTDQINVKAVITLGSPMNGTHIASIGLGQCARQMRHGPANTYLTDLHKRISEAKSVAFYHFGSRTDLVVRPTESALMPGAQCFEAKNCGHASFLFSREVAEKVAACCKESLG